MGLRTMTKRHRQHPEAGVTLMELMLTVGIVTGSLVMIMSSIGGIATGGALAGAKTSAASITQSLLEDISQLTPSKALSYEPLIDPDDEGVYHLASLGSFTLTIEAIIDPDTDERFTIGGGADPSGVVTPDPMEVAIIMQVLSGTPFTYSSSTFLSAS